MESDEPMTNDERWRRESGLHPDYPMSDMMLIDKIQFIRTKNNQCWMDILRLTMLHAPEKTKEIMTEIAKNDAEINELTKELAK